VTHISNNTATSFYVKLNLPSTYPGSVLRRKPKTYTKLFLRSSYRGHRCRRCTF